MEIHAWDDAEFTLDVMIMSIVSGRDESLARVLTLWAFCASRDVALQRGEEVGG